MASDVRARRDPLGRGVRVEAGVVFGFALGEPDSATDHRRTPGR
ncbi:hypothetical protein [Mycolicibacterium rhodesiae]|nr:hypothetical protein [Mycolicibacterium rhodesiae]